MSGNTIVFFLITVFLIPAVITYFLAIKKIKIGWAFALLMPYVCIFFYGEIMQFLTPLPESRPLSYSAPMELVVYVIYGVPSAFLSAFIWDRFKKK